MTILRLAIREIRSNGRFSAAFCLNLGLGLLGFVLLSAFQASIESSFQARSRTLLTADLAVSARRELTTDELARLRATVGAAALETHVVEMYAMATSGKASRLVEVVGIDERFPLYGEIELKSGRKVLGTTPKPLFSASRAWISPELAVQMGLAAGAKLRLGDTEFSVDEIIERDASTGWRGFSFAPRLYVGKPWLARTGLVKKGSTVSHGHLFRLDGATDDELDRLASSLNQALPDPAIRVSTHRTAGEQMTRALSYLSDYLGLVALVGLFLAALGSAYLFQSFLGRNLKQIATLISLGLTHAEAVWVYVLQSVLLGLASVVFALGSSFLALPAITAELERALETPLGIDAGFLAILPSLGAALAGGIAISVLICLPIAVRIRSLKPAVLFQESASPRLAWSRASALAALPVAFLAYFLSVWQAHSWRVGSLFYVSLACSAIGMAGLAVLALRAIGRMRSSQPITRLSLRYLSRNPLSTVSAFLAIGLGALLINLLPQLQRSIESEIERPEVSSVPSLFLFDIQEDQVERLQAALKSEGVSVMQVSPLVRARMEAVNGKPFEKPVDLTRPTTREEEQEARSRNRGFNLTYRARLSESESLLEGREFSQATSEPAEISVEFRSADRLGLKLGDVLRFSVEGVPVEGRIVSLRRVRWTSFQPNFFVVFQPGALDEAPKTFLASVQKLPLEDRSRVQERIVREFNNVSIIDVTQVVQKMMQAFQQMAFAIRMMAALAVLAGLVVLFSIANHQARSRQTEIQLLKVLGAGTGDVSRLFLIEFGTIGVLSSALGVSISLGISYVISRELFDRAWSFTPWLPLGTVVGVTGLALVTTQLAAFRGLRRKPAELLGGESS
ncbi:MAG TPA: FtsX-like permease family protein [Bdellovibrionota bacterium]|nr:FtsX-like permease family protein [Bdellovibrionota bacterium]